MSEELKRKVLDCYGKDDLEKVLAIEICDNIKNFITNKNAGHYLVEYINNHLGLEHNKNNKNNKVKEDNYDKIFKKQFPEYEKIKIYVKKEESHFDEYSDYFRSELVISIHDSDLNKNITFSIDSGMVKCSYNTYHSLIFESNNKKFEIYIETYQIKLVDIEISNESKKEIKQIKKNVPKNYLDFILVICAKYLDYHGYNVDFEEEIGFQLLSDGIDSIVKRSNKKY